MLACFSKTFKKIIIYILATIAEKSSPFFKKGELNTFNFQF